MSGFFTNVLLLLAAIFISSVCFLIKRVYWHPLSQFPGPPLAATTSFYQFHKLWKGQEGPWYRNLHLKYGIHLALFNFGFTIDQWLTVLILFLQRLCRTMWTEPLECQ